jgi:hypothetical protein
VDEFTGWGVPVIGTSYTDVAACLTDAEDVQECLIPIAQTDKGDSIKVSFYQDLMRKRDFGKYRFTIKTLSCVKQFAPLYILANGSSCGHDAFHRMVSQLKTYSKEIGFPIWEKYEKHLTD